MTDNEIIKALECCATNSERSCEKCPLLTECRTDTSTAEKHALALINRQKAEIEGLTQLFGFYKACHINLIKEMLGEKAVDEETAAKAWERANVGEDK